MRTTPRLCEGVCDIPIPPSTHATTIAFDVFDICWFAFGSFYQVSVDRRSAYPRRTNNNKQRKFPQRDWWSEEKRWADGRYKYQIRDITTIFASLFVVQWEGVLVSSSKYIISIDSLLLSINSGIPLCCFIEFLVISSFLFHFLFQIYLPKDETICFENIRSFDIAECSGEFISIGITKFGSKTSRSVPTITPTATTTKATNIILTAKATSTTSVIGFFIKFPSTTRYVAYLDSQISTELYSWPMHLTFW